MTIFTEPSRILPHKSFFSSLSVHRSDKRLLPPGTILRLFHSAAGPGISVGAIKMLWYPLSRIQYMAKNAPPFFPLPTSPCTRRLIACSPARSSRFPASRACAAVSSNGRRSTNALTEAGLILMRLLFWERSPLQAIPASG